MSAARWRPTRSLRHHDVGRVRTIEVQTQRVLQRRDVGGTDGCLRPVDPGRVVAQPRHGLDAVDLLDLVGHGGRERHSDRVGDHVVRGEALLDRLVHARLRGLADDRHRGHQRQPDHQRRRRRRGPSRIAYGVLLRQPPDRAEHAPVEQSDRRDDRTTEHRAGQGHAEQHQQRATSDEPDRVVDTGEQTQTDAGGAERDHRDADDQPAADRALWHRDVVAQRLDRRDPAGPPTRQVRREGRHDHAHGVGHDRRTWLEHETAAGQVEAELGEDRLQPLGEAESEREAHRRPDEADHQRLKQHRPCHLPAARAERTEQRQLAAALGDQDRERVDDQEGADEQRDRREHQQKRRDEAERLGDVAGQPRPPTSSPLSATKPARQHLVDAVGAARPG